MKKSIKPNNLYAALVGRVYLQMETILLIAANLGRYLIRTTDFSTQLMFMYSQSPFSFVVEVMITASDIGCCWLGVERSAVSLRGWRVF